MPYITHSCKMTDKDCCHKLKMGAALTRQRSPLTMMMEEPHRLKPKRKMCHKLNITCTDRLRTMLSNHCCLAVRAGLYFQKQVMQKNVIGPASSLKLATAPQACDSNSIAVKSANLDLLRTRSVLQKRPRRGHIGWNVEGSVIVH